MNAMNQRLRKIVYFCRFGKTALLTCVAAALVAFSPVHVHAQAGAGLAGTVVDSSGAAIPDVTIKLRNTDTGVAQTITSSGSGSFSVPGLLPGNYDLTYVKSGFSTLSQKQVVVSVGSVTSLTPMLNAGTEGTVVTVTADQLQLQTEIPSDDTTVSPQLVTELPIPVGNAPRQIDSFIFLTPGTTGNGFSHRVNGGADFQNEVLFNGTALTYAESQGYQTVINPPFEAISEFKISRSVFTSQYGLGQGAINYQFRSGTNKLHGVVYEYLRNDALDARPFSFGGNLKKNINKQHDFGFGVGGPILLPHLFNGKDKLFFNTTISWYRYTGGSPDNSPRTVPTAAFKSGDFSALLPSTLIYDPSTGAPFPGNVIPAARISAISKIITGYIPDPDVAGLQNNIFPQIRKFPTKNFSYANTIDYNISDKQSIHFTSWRSHSTVLGLNGGSVSFLNNPLSSLTEIGNLGSGAVLNYSTAVTPHLIAQAGVLLLGYSYPKHLVFAAASPIPGIAAQAFPGLYFDGSIATSSLGSNGTTTSTNRGVGFTASNNWAWQRGKNSFNFGGEFRLPKQNKQECGLCAGNFGFSTRQTANPTNVSQGGNSFASFLLGLPNQVNQQNALEGKLRSKAISFYVQDDMHVTPRLTVNLGLRYDLLVPFTEVNDNVPFFSATIPNPGAGNIPGALTKLGNCTGCAGYRRADVYKKHFSPRLGFAYRLDDKSVVRGGFALLTLNGGSYEFGSSEIANSYVNTLSGQTTFNSTGGTTSSYGEYDKPFPAAQLTPFSPTLGLGGSVSAFDRSTGRAPYIETWNAAMEREILPGMVASLTYTANRVKHLAGNLNVINQGNPANLGLGSILLDRYDSARAQAAGIKAPYPGFGAQYGNGATVARALLPFPQYGYVGNNYDLNSSTAYDALEVQVQKQSRSGFNILASYVWSKSLGNADQGFSAFQGGAANKYDQRAEYAIAPSDVRHVLKANGTYELPVGVGKRFLNKRSNPLAHALGNWQVGAVTTYTSGTPVGIGLSGSTPVSALGFFSRPIRVEGVPAVLPDKNKLIYQRRSYLNPAAFTFPGPFQLTSSKPRYGDIRTPGFAEEDINLVKHFYVSEYVNIEFRAEFFNVLNRVEFGGPDSNIGSPGGVGAAPTLNPNFGNVSGASNSPRTGQVALRVSF